MGWGPLRGLRTVVLALRNDPQTGLLNGTRARLERIDDQRRVLILDTEGSSVRVGVPFAYAEAGHLTHGYALTIQNAQGATVDTCHVLVGDSTTQQHLYTAMSRGRTANHLYACGDELRALDAHTCEIARTAEQAVASALARDSRQRMATDGSDNHVPVVVLAAEANRLRRILRDEPPNPSRDLAAITAAHQRTRKEVAAARAEVEAIRRSVDGAGPLSRALHRGERKEQVRRVEVLDQEVARLDGRLVQLAHDRSRLEPQLARWRAWSAEHRPEKERLVEVEQHLVRADRLAQALEPSTDRWRGIDHGIEL